MAAWLRLHLLNIVLPVETVWSTGVAAAEPQQLQLSQWQRVGMMTFHWLVMHGSESASLEDGEREKVGLKEPFAKEVVWAVLLCGLHGLKVRDREKTSHREMALVSAVLRDGLKMETAAVCASYPLKIQSLLFLL